MKKVTVAESLTNFATGRNVGLFWLSFMTLYMLMTFLVGPILATYSSELPMDAHLNYSVTWTYQFLTSLTEHGRNLYVTVISSSDMIFPVLYAFAFTLLATFLFKKAALQESLVFKVRFLPFVAGLFDILENICFIIVVRNYPKELPRLVRVANVFTMLKFAGMWIGLMFVLIGVFAIIKNRVFRGSR